VSARVRALTGHQQVNNMDRIRSAFRSPKKSTQTASTELETPGTTVRRVLHIRLRFKSYKTQLLQSLLEEDKVRRAAFCQNFIAQLEDEKLDLYLVFSDEATFHLSGIVNKQTVFCGESVLMPMLNLHMTCQR
jgi:hypothetical protein